MADKGGDFLRLGGYPRTPVIQLSTDQLRRLDKQHLWHPFTHMKLWNESDPPVIVAAEGMHLIDSEGNRYLDGVSSLWCNVHGHRVPEIDSAIHNQLDKVAHTTMLGLASEPAIMLAERLMKLVPPGLKKVFYSDAGATATEVAFKLAAQYWFNIGKPGKNEFVGFTEAYHGDTVGAMSVGRTTAFHRPYFPLLFKVHYAPTPFVYRSSFPRTPEEVKRDSLDELEKILQQRAEQIAAVCIEPIVQGAAGIIVHPEGFLRGVRELCSKYDVLMIADEVAVGFGRTGKMFACEHENVSPDLMCVAKGITGGYLPLAATLATQTIFDAFLGDPWEGKTFFHGHTYTGNPLACAAAIASLDLFEKNDVLDNVQSRANQFRLAQANSHAFDREPYLGEVRTRGLMFGFELVADKQTKTPFDPRRRVGAEFCMRLRKRGVILRPLGDVIVVMPPLAVQQEDFGKIMDAVRRELEEMPSWL